MRAEVNSADFAASVGWATHVIAAKPASPILQGIKLTVKDGMLTFECFDHAQTARCQIEADSDEDGVAVAAGRTLAEITKHLPAEKTVLETRDTRLTVASGKAKWTLPLMPADEFPQMPQIPEAIGSVDGETFAHAVAQAAISVSRDESRPVLTAILMEFEGDKITLSSTDRFRLGRVAFSWTPADPDIHAKAQVRGTLLRDIARSIDTTSNVVIGLDVNNPRLLSIENAGHVSTTQLIEGNFPTISGLFKDDYPIQAVLNRQDLIGCVERVGLVAEKNAAIRLNFTEGELTVSAGEDDESQAVETMPVDLDGDPLIVGFGPVNLMDGLKAIDEPFVRFKLESAIRAAELDGQQEADSDESLDFRYIVVPIRLGI